MTAYYPSTHHFISKKPPKSLPSLQHVLLLPSHHQSTMAQQLTANESTPLLTPDPLHPSMEQQVEGRDPHPTLTSSDSNTVTQPSVEDTTLSFSTSSRSSTIMQLDHGNASTLPLLSPSQHNAVEQQHEERELNTRAALNSPRVEHECAQGFFSGTNDLGTEQQHEHTPSSLSTLGKLSSDVQHSIGDDSASNAFALQVKTRQSRPFSLSDPTQSSIMRHRSSHAEAASAGRSSAPQQGMPNVDPKRVKQLISTLRLDDQQSEMLYKLVIATAPFHNNTEAQLTPPAPEGSIPEADVLHEALDNLVFAPKSPPETRPGSPPLLWSTAAAEESLDPDAEEPTQYTVAQFVNTIIEKGIQVESVTDEDWCIEEVRVAILNRLKHDTFANDLAEEEGSNELGVTKEEASENVTVEEDSSKLAVTKEEATEEVKAREDTVESDLQRWKEQGPNGWLKRDDGTDMNEEEIDEDCARLDAMVMKARNEKKAKEVRFSLGNNIDLKDKGFWAYVRSSKQKEQAQGSTSVHGQDGTASVSIHDPDEKASQKKKKKGSNKNKNKNRKAKKSALKSGDQGDVSEEVRDEELIFDFLDLPTEARKKVLGFVLVVHQELVPYHYVKGKVVKNVGLRTKPELKILLALCSSQDKRVKRCLDDAKNILYRGNTFSIRKPTDLIMFLGTIGGDNLARMKLGKNLLLTNTFFDKKRQYVLQMKWLARWGKDLLFAMKGWNIFRSDLAADSSEDDLTCEPTDLEKALKSMVEVMRDEGKMFGMWNEDLNGGGSMRLQSLDLGDKFDSLAEQIKTMGLAVGDDKVTSSETAKAPETDASEKAVESMTEKWKRKTREAGKKVMDEGEADEGEADEYGENFLKMVASLDGADEDSGFYTPSVYSEHGKNALSPAKYSINMIR